MIPRRLAAALALLTLLVMGSFLGGGGPLDGLGMSGFAAGRAAPILIVGVDGADWLAIDPLIAAGRLPSFAMLKRVGVTGVMRPEPPLLSPNIWTRWRASTSAKFSTARAICAATTASSRPSFAPTH